MEYLEGAGGSGSGKPGGRLCIVPKRLQRAKDRICEITRRNRGHVKVRQRMEELNNFLGGWIPYVQYAEGKVHLERLGDWMRRKLRCIILKRLNRARTTADFVQRPGVPEFQAWILGLSGKGWWPNAAPPATQHAMNKQGFAKTTSLRPDSQV